MKVHLYYNSTKVKSVRIKKGADWKQDYKVTIFGKKKILWCKHNYTNIKTSKSFTHNR